MSEVYLDSREVYGQTIPRVVSPAQTIERIAEKSSEIKFISSRREIEFEEKLGIDNHLTRRIPRLKFSLIRDNSTGRIYMALSLSEEKTAGLKIDYLA